MEFVWNNNVVGRMLISVQNCKVMSLSGSPFWDVFLLNQHTLLNFPEMSYKVFTVVLYRLLVTENNMCNWHWIFCMYDTGCCSEYQAEMLHKQSMHSGAFVDQNPFVSILFTFAFDLGNSWSELSLVLTRFIQVVSLFWSLHLCVLDRVCDILRSNCLAFHKTSNFCTISLLLYWK